MKKIIPILGFIYSLSLLCENQAEFITEQLIINCRNRIACGKSKVVHKRCRADTKRNKIKDEYKEKKAPQITTMIASGTVMGILVLIDLILAVDNDLDANAKIGCIAVSSGLALATGTLCYFSYKKMQQLKKEEELELKIIDQRIAYYKTKQDMLVKELETLLSKNISDQN